MDGDAASGARTPRWACPGWRRSPRAADPAAAAPGGEPGSELLGTVVPALLGGVTGLVGGLVREARLAAGLGGQQAERTVGGLTQAATSAAQRRRAMRVSLIWSAGWAPATSAAAQADFWRAAIGGGETFAGDLGIQVYDWRRTTATPALRGDRRWSPAHSPLPPR